MSKVRSTAYIWQLVAETAKNLINLFREPKLQFTVAIEGYRNDASSLTARLNGSSGQVILQALGRELRGGDTPGPRYGLHS